MSQLTASPVPTFLGGATFRRISVDEYHRLIRTGFLEHGEPIELLEGYMVLKMPRDPAHDFARQALNKRLLRLLPAGWDIRGQSAVTLSDSEPEPDYAVVRGDESNYRNRHPEPSDIAVAIEVANTSLKRDSLDKTRIYARAGIPVYWVVNLVDRQVEVFSGPSGPAAAPAYATRDIYLPGSDVPVVLDGTRVGSIPVDDLLP